MDTLLKDLRFALRSLRKNPAFTTVAVIALALGIGANSAIFSVVNAVLIQPLPFREPDKLVALWGNVKRAVVERRGASLADYVDWKAQSKSYESMAAYWGATFTLFGNGEPERLPGEVVDVDYFALLGVQPAMGRVFRAADEGKPGAAPVAVLGDGLWQRRFGGDPAILGRAIQLDARQVTIIGVMPRGFRGAADQAEIWMPMNSLMSVAEMRDRGGRWFSALARLKPGVAREQAQAEISSICASLEQAYPVTNEKRSAEVASLSGEILRDIKPALLVILAAVGFVLLIACANVANLLLARAEKRQREIAIRTALGAGRWRLARQLITEGLVLAVLGAGLGGVIAVWGVDALLAASPVEFPSFTSVRLDPMVALFTLAVTVLTGVALGLAPVVHSAVGRLHESLKESSGRSSDGASRQRLRGLLVISEVALALVLLIGAGLLIRSFQKLAALNPGFNPDNLLTLRVGLPRLAPPAGASPATPPLAPSLETAAAARTILERVRALPSVTAASLGSDIPLAGEGGAVFYSAENQAPVTAQNMPRAYIHRVTPGFFATLGIPILRGRDFNPGENDGVVVSESVWKRFWPDQDPIGRRLKAGRPDSNAPWITVIGVVSETNYRALPRNPTADPDIYLPFSERARQFALFVRTGIDPTSLTPALRSELRQIDPSVVIFNVAAMQERIGRQTARSRFTSWLMGIFSGVALLLAVVGISGVVSYSVARRTQEIGIRMALGAGSNEVMGMVVRNGLMLILPGVGIGLVLALGVTRLLTTLLFGVGASDPATFAAVALLVTAVAMIAAWIPALRATRIDPMVALRYE